jgi:SAM-dependent methyltransferase
MMSVEPNKEKESVAGNDDWELHWQRFADSAALNPAQAMRHQLVLDLWGERAADTSANFVDFGSGQGDFLEKFQRRYPHAKLLGLELSARGVAISRKKVPSATFIAADLFSPSQEIDSYRGWARGAVCSEVLEHLDDPTAFLRAASQYLGANALILITVPGGRMSAFDRHIGHRQHFTRESLHEILVRGGYRVEKIYRAGFPFFNLYRLAVIARGYHCPSLRLAIQDEPARFALRMANRRRRFQASSAARSMIITYWPWRSRLAERRLDILSSYHEHHGSWYRGNH